MEVQGCNDTTKQAAISPIKDRLTANIFNIQLYIFVTTFGKHKFIHLNKMWST